MTRSVVQVHISPPSGVVAQLFRAPPLQGGGPGLESLLLHQVRVLGSLLVLVYGVSRLLFDGYECDIISIWKMILITMIY